MATVVFVMIVNMMVIVKTLSLLFIVLLTISCSKKYNFLENIEQRMKDVQTKEKVLTENEKELVKEATEKEWNELDK